MAARKHYLIFAHFLSDQQWSWAGDQFSLQVNSFRYK